MPVIFHAACRRLSRAMLAFALVLWVGVSAAAADDRTVCNSKDSTPDAAVEACSRLLAGSNLKGRGRAVTLFNRAIAWKKKGDLDRAFADYSQAISLEPNYNQAFNNRGLIWADKGDFDRAIADYDQAIRIEPKYTLALRNRAHAWRKKGNLDRAIADYNEAIRLDPVDADAFFNRGYTMRQKGDAERAVADYSETIRLNPRHTTAYYNRAIIWRSKGELDRAISDYSEVIRIDPGYSGAFAGRGLAYESKGERERAKADFTAALALPVKHDSGEWAQKTARARLAVLAPGGAASPASPVVIPNIGSIVVPPGGGVAPSAAGGRLALVIGNGAYRNASALPNPPNDARAVAKALREIGFEVMEGVDLDHRAMETLLRSFLQRSSAARTALVFYAGHGVQIDGRNYLMPVDATKQLSKSTVAFELIDVDRIIGSLDDEARANILILDACRDNPLASRTATVRSDARGSGLAGYSSVASGMLIAFATAPGKTAEDGTGMHSPFTAALLKHVKTPRLEVNQMLTRVRVDVVAATEKKQVPWVNSSLLGEVYLTGDQKASAIR